MMPGGYDSIIGILNEILIKFFLSPGYGFSWFSFGFELLFESRRHRQKILAEISPLSRFCQRFQRAVGYTWLEFWWLHKQLPEQTDFVLEDELDSDLRWAQERKLSLAYDHKTALTMNQDIPEAEWSWKEMCPDLAKVNLQNSRLDGPFYKALTGWELQNLLDYKWMWPSEAWQLNQSASTHGQHSNAAYLHTLIKNCHLIFCDQVQPPRWLSPCEMLLGGCVWALFSVC